MAALKKVKIAPEKAWNFVEFAKTLWYTENIPIARMQAVERGESYVSGDQIGRLLG